MAIKRIGKLPLIDPKIIDAEIQKALIKVGIKGVSWAIENHEFSNITNNLEDSYGFAIYKNGSMIGDPFTFSKNATQTRDGESGREEALKFLNSYKPESEGWTLVVAAPMSYAPFVQFMYGLDVLQGSEIIARQLADKLLNNIKWKSK